MSISAFFSDAFGDSKNGVKAGGIISAIGATALGYYAGDWMGGALGLVGGVLLGPVVNNLIGSITGGGKAKETWPHNGLSYAPPVVPQPEQNLVVPGITLQHDPKLPAGFTLKPNLEKIKKLEFDIGRLTAQTDEAERIKDKAHKDNAFVELDKKYKALFQFEVNFNEYNRLAKEYNASERPKLVAQYEALLKEKAQLEGAPYTGNAEAEAPKLPTSDVAMLSRKECIPNNYNNDLKIAREFPDHPEYLTGVEQRYSQPYAINTDKKMIDVRNTSVWQAQKVNDSLFGGGSKGETLFLADHGDYTSETNPDKLRDIWKNMAYVQKIQVVEKGLAREFDDKTKNINFDILAQTSDWNEFKKGFGNVVNGASDGLVTLVTFGQVSPPKSRFELGVDSASAMQDFRKMLDVNRPPRIQVENIVNRALANPATPAAKAEWEKLRDMLELIDQRNKSRQAVIDFTWRDINPKQIYIEKKLKPFVAQAEAFEKKVHGLEQEVARLKAVKPTQAVATTQYLRGNPLPNTNPCNEQKAAKIGGTYMMYMRDPNNHYNGSICACGTYDEATKTFTVVGFELRPHHTPAINGGHYFAYNGTLNTTTGAGFADLFKAIMPETVKPQYQQPNVKPTGVPMTNTVTFNDTKLENLGLFTAPTLPAFPSIPTDNYAFAMAA